VLTRGLPGCASLVVVTKEREGSRKALLHGRSGHSFRDASPVRHICQLRPKLGQRVLAVGMLDADVKRRCPRVALMHPSEFLQNYRRL
jgi:hypothetical protein